VFLLFDHGVSYVIIQRKIIMITQEDIKKAVNRSVEESVWYPVWYPVRYSVWDSVRNSVWYSVWDFFRMSVEIDDGNSVSQEINEKSL
jgi:hypothetical protein